MGKHKDPAFLFYPESFLVGVMDMTDEEVGQYIKAMCRQHQKGHIPDAIMAKYLPAVQEKFVQDDDGNWYNVRLEEEIRKRAKFTESRRRNLEGGKKDAPEEPEEKKKTGKKDNVAEWIMEIVPEELQGAFMEWATMRKKAKKPIATKETVSRNYAHLCRLSKRVDKQRRIVEQSVNHCWASFYELKDKTPAEQKPKPKEAWEKEDFVAEPMPEGTKEKLQALGFGNIIGRENEA